MNDRQSSGLVSIHDLMPTTLDNCLDIIELLKKRQVDTITLLVVPGLNWSTNQLEILQALQKEGLILAGHGWEHRSDVPSTIYHRLHSILLSRRAAEHLSLNPTQIIALIQRNYEWFTSHDLNTPSLYVPPAWAMGKVSQQDLGKLPFTHYEFLEGVYDSKLGKLLPLALAGYEADTIWRAEALAPWNHCNEIRAKYSSQPLRIGIHPFDTSLKLSKQLFAQLDRCDSFRSYSDLQPKPKLPNRIDQSDKQGGTSSRRA